MSRRVYFDPSFYKTKGQAAAAGVVVAVATKEPAQIDEIDGETPGAPTGPVEGEFCLFKILTLFKPH